jgi:hypothetical protein
MNKNLGEELESFGGHLEFEYHVSKPVVRAHRLNDGDIFTLKNELTLQFENKVFHEVIFSGYDEYMQSIWDKTGKIYSAEELNEYCK